MHSEYKDLPTLTPNSLSFIPSVSAHVFSSPDTPNFLPFFKHALFYSFTSSHMLCFFLHCPSFLLVSIFSNPHSCSPWQNFLTFEKPNLMSIPLWNLSKIPTTYFTSDQTHNPKVFWIYLSYCMVSGHLSLPTKFEVLKGKNMSCSIFYSQNPKVLWDCWFRQSIIVQGKALCV